MIDHDKCRLRVYSKRMRDSDPDNALPPVYGEAADLMLEAADLIDKLREDLDEMAKALQKISHGELFWDRTAWLARIAREALEDKPQLAAK